MPTDIDRNLHVHTWLSTCARSEHTLTNVMSECARLGYRWVVISDHHHEPERDYEAMRRYNQRRIAALQPQYPQTRVVLGCEAQMDDPEHCSIDAGLAARYEVVACACNHYGGKLVEWPAVRSSRGFAEHHLRMLQGAIATGFVHVIVHPFLNGSVGGVDPAQIYASFHDGEIADVVAQAAAHGVALEVNPSRAEPAAAWFREVVQAVRAAGGAVSLGSDAHRLVQLGYPRRDDPTRSYTWADLDALFGLRPTDLFTPLRSAQARPQVERVLLAGREA
ncbi:MAG: hypothetical protein GX557_03415 [Chloroflexi bacterium]|nr:hypothetical protein [Chloroflexota bacterium]